MCIIEGDIKALLKVNEWIWYQDDSAVCLSLNMHKWINEESKCMHGCIKHFHKHLRWKLSLSVVAFVFLLPFCQYIWVKMSFQKPQGSACSECTATKYCDRLKGCKWNPALSTWSWMRMWSFSTHSHGSWPVQKLEHCVSQCQLHWLVTFNQRITLI